MSQEPLLGNDNGGYDNNNNNIESEAAPAFKPILYTFMVCLGPLCFGYGMTFTGPIGNQFMCTVDGQCPCVRSDNGKTDYINWWEPHAFPHNGVTVKNYSSDIAAHDFTCADIVQQSSGEQQPAGSTDNPCPSGMYCPAAAGKGIGATPSQTGTLAAMVMVGALLGALLLSVLLDSIGRRRTITISAVLFAAGFLVSYVAKDFSTMLAARVINGLGVGVVSGSAPTYIAEIAPSRLRGFLGCCNQFGVVLGILIIYCLGAAAMGEGQAEYGGTDFRLCAVVGVVLSALLFACSLLVPPSPSWLISKGRDGAAEAALRRLRGPAFDCRAEIEAIKAGQDTSGEKATLSDVFRGTSRPAFFIGAGLMFYQQVSGINAILLNGGELLKDGGQTNANLAMVYFSIVQLIFTGIGVAVVDKTGRRSLLIFAGIGMAMVSFLLATFFLKSDDEEWKQGHTWIPLFSVLAYIAFFSVGLGALPWLMMSELSPLKTKGLSSSLLTCWNWGLSFAVVQSAPIIKQGLSNTGLCILYGVVCALGAAWTNFFLPETKGKTLEQVQAFFEKGVKDPPNPADMDLIKITAYTCMLFFGVVLMTQF